MASTDRIFVSPGVFTSEKDLTFVTRQVGVTTLGLLGETPKGPAFEPVFISNYDEFISYFGGLNAEKFKGNGFQKYELNYIAKSFLTQTNQLWVSRVLGLSGYDAGNAWSITLDAAHDPATEASGSTSSPNPLLNYTATTAGTPITMDFVGDANLQALYDAGQITPSFTSIGLLDTGSTISITTPAYIKDETACTFSGATFDMEVIATGTTPGFVTGTTSGTVVSYTASCYSDIDGSVIATLRSRGTYNGAEQLVFDITGSTDVAMFNTSNLPSDSLASFQITGTTSAGLSIDYDVSMDKTSKNYLPKVFGSSPQDKETELWVEEIYGNVLEDLITNEKVRGLDIDFVNIGSTTTDNLNDYKEKWLSAYSPWVLSELKGTGAGSTLQRLFRFITISDGNAANDDVKFSIINIRPDNKTFDLMIRNFNDTDANPSVVEKFSNLSMDSTSNGYIARKIGTTDGEYPLRSKYIMVELYDENDPDLKNHFPAGFEGVLNRTYVGSNRTAIAPKIEYKTAYSEFTTSKLRKTYLGLNSTIGVDQDFFDYKGIKKVSVGITDANGKNTYSGRTDGFHLDVNSTSGVIDAGVNTYTPSLQVGVSAFTTDSGLVGGPYEKLAARKFTFTPFGGYDGWDEYRTQRTNGDSYTKTGSKGSVGFQSGLFDTYVTSEGDDGITSDYYAFLDGIYTYNNPEAVNINVFASPGLDLQNQISLVEGAVDMVEVDRADSLYVMTTPDVDADNVALTVGEAVDLVEDSGIDSNYSATYWPWLQMNDTENNRYVWLPPTVEVMRNIALTDNVAFPWFAAAGLNRGTTNAVKARVKLRLDDRDTLYEGRINPMATFSDVGVVIFGNKTLQVKETALNRINVRRLLLQARKLISAVSIRLLFEQNDEVVRNQFLSLVNPILDNIRKERGLTDFRVTLDDTPESIDRNELNGRVFIKPTRSLEYISIEFNITNTGANFDDI